MSTARPDSSSVPVHQFLPRPALAAAVEGEDTEVAGGGDADEDVQEVLLEQRRHDEDALLAPVREVVVARAHVVEHARGVHPDGAEVKVARGDTVPVLGRVQLGAVVLEY